MVITIIPLRIQNNKNWKNIMTIIKKSFANRQNHFHTVIFSTAIHLNTHARVAINPPEIGDKFKVPPINPRGQFSGWSSVPIKSSDNNLK